MSNPNMPRVLDDEGFPFEYAAIVPTMLLGDSEPSVVIGISKVGGGTPGESYSGTWEYRVTLDGEPVIDGSDLRSGAMGATHAEMCRSLCNFLSAAGESLYSHDGMGGSEYDNDYSEVQVAFLVDAYERLSMFGAGLS